MVSPQGRMDTPQINDQGAEEATDLETSNGRDVDEDTTTLTVDDGNSFLLISAGVAK